MQFTKLKAHQIDLLSILPNLMFAKYAMYVYGNKYTYKMYVNI